MSYETRMIEVCVRADAPGEADDAIAEALRELLSQFAPGSYWIDWRYVNGAETKITEALPDWCEYGDVRADDERDGMGNRLDGTGEIDTGDNPFHPESPEGRAWETGDRSPVEN